MTERKRLIELIRFAYQQGRMHEEQKQVEETMVDYLLANGVIVPPCKVGDTVYWISDENLDTREPELAVLEDEVPIKGIFITENDVYVSTGSFEDVISLCDKVNEDIYLRQELAEHALKDDFRKDVLNDT